MYRSWQWRWRHRAETKQCHPEHPFPESQFVHLSPRSQHVALQRHIGTSFYTISKYFCQKKKRIKGTRRFYRKWEDQNYSELHESRYVESQV